MYNSYICYNLLLLCFLASDALLIPLDSGWIYLSNTYKANIPTIFYAWVWTFSRKGGGGPNPNPLRNLCLLNLEIFKEGGGEAYPNQNFIRNFCLLEIRKKKKNCSNMSKDTRRGGGGQGQGSFFFPQGLPKAGPACS